MAKVAYVRVSTIDQNEARQVEALDKYGIDKWYKEKVSAKNTNRPKLQAMLDYVREGDTVYILDFSRMARSTSDLLNLIEQLKAKGVQLVSHKENIDTSTPTGKLMVTMIAAINEFERANLLERQREGIAIAKAEGKYAGRNAVTVNNLLEHYKRYMQRLVSKSELAQELKISRPTLNKLFSELEQKEGFTKSKPIWHSIDSLIGEDKHDSDEK